MDNDKFLWESFGWPTDTLLPEQQLTKTKSLVSSKSKTNRSSGPYKLYFDNDNVLHLLFQSPEVSSRYWPLAWLSNCQAGRTEYNSSRVAVLNSSGYFSSSDDFKFSSVDVGVKCLRRLTLDPDGNLRLYSLEETNGRWVVSWQSSSNPCKVHGVCGPNSICSYDPSLGRRCTCIPGYKAKIPTDWSSGCEPDFDPNKDESEFSFTKVSHNEFYGYDSSYSINYTFERCKKLCFKMRSCKGFQYKFKGDADAGYFECFTKAFLYNGMLSPSFNGDMYLKLPKGTPFSGNILDKQRGLAVFKPGLAVEVPKDEKYKVGFTDFVHAIMSVMVFVAIAFSDHRVTDCLFPGHVKEMDQVMESFPLMVGIVCSGLFLLFPNTRYGVGCMAT
ncbi:hypothetical protein GH714_043632 [Hevea brasiliensis]|uniref:EGF-like domain-containing protein n=1 Tax=Hevea brasiliensis TaxID=3981 RepID=A0A6A6K3W4_HEVBR|nr:hypothetical protein GH714_043632 [Hevea brasiliensis]